MAAASTDLAFLSATELVEHYRRKDLSPVEVTQATLDRIGKLDKELNAYCLLDPEGALATARESEARWAKGAPLGLIDGVPTSIKDLALAKGWPTLRGSLIYSADQKATEDAPVVARLREAGAVFLGKTTTPELGWKAIGDSPRTGITRNPWSLGHTPGGSSAGAAASVAAGMGALATGTDGGGSIRIPCSFTGLPGIKATYGRVPGYPASAMGLLSHVGPMARTVHDLALMLNVMVGDDARDPYRLPASGVDYRIGLDDGVRGLRIGYSATLGYARVDPEVAASVAAAAEVFADLGAHVEAVDPGFSSPRDAFICLWAAGAARALKALTAAERDKLDPGFRKVVDQGLTYSAIDYLDADAERTRLGEIMGAFHRRYDLLLTPTVAVPALPVGHDLTDPETQTHWVDWTPFSYPFNMTRQPATSVPCGFTKSGLPIGLQLVGRLYDEPTVLRASRAFESRHPFRASPFGR